MPVPRSRGTHHITITVSNGLGKATAKYSLSVGVAPTFTRVPKLTAVAGRALSFEVKTSSYPRPRFTHTPLPLGLKWSAHGGTTATISGRPRATAIGAHDVTITAHNAFGTVKQVLVIKVT